MSKNRKLPIAMQFIHPNNQTIFKKNSLENEKAKWAKVGCQIFRLWNYESHIRRPMVSAGEYIDENGVKCSSDKLYFWGEWEDSTRYDEQLNLHKPMLTNRPTFVKTNTDPYVFGSSFKYTNCKQKGGLVRMEQNSIVLFGCKKGNGFLLDTVFVVKNYTTFSDTRKKNQSDAFKITVLDALLNEKKKVVHSAQMYGDNMEYFSFVPCKLDCSKGVDRLKIPFGKFGLSKSPYNRYIRCNCNIRLWQKIKDYALKQGFVLGFNFAEPTLEAIDFSRENIFAAKKKWPRECVCVKSRDKSSKGTCVQ